MRKTVIKVAATIMSASMMMSGLSVTALASEDKALDATTTGAGVDIKEDIEDATTPADDEIEEEVDEFEDKKAGEDDIPEAEILEDGIEPETVKGKESEKNEEDKTVEDDDHFSETEVEYSLESMPEEKAAYISETYGESVLNTYDIVVPEGTEFPVQITFEANVKEGQTVVLYHFTGDEWEEIQPDRVEEGSITATFKSLSPVAVIDKTDDKDNDKEDPVEKKIITVDGVDYDVTYAESWDVSDKQDGELMAYYFCQDGTNYVLISGRGNIKDYMPNPNYGEVSPLCDLPDYTVVWDDHGIFSIGAYFFFNGGPFEPHKGIITSLPDNLWSIQQQAFAGSKFNAEIPDGIYMIGAYAFSECDELTITSIPDSVEILDFGAFHNCKNITSMKLPSELTEIPDRLFEDCDNLEEVVIPDGIYSIGKYAFYGCKNLKMDRLPSGVEYIGESAFRKCSSLTVDSIPGSVVTIDKSAFYQSGVTISELPIRLTNIGGYAFFGCTNITHLDFSSAICMSEIPYSCFEKCTNLSSIVIPRTIWNIDNAAFKNCVSLTDITAEGNAQLGNKVFYVSANDVGEDNTCTLNDITYSVPFKTTVNGSSEWLSTYDFKADNRIMGGYTITLPMSIDLAFENGEAKGSIDIGIENETNGWDIQILENVSKELTSELGDVLQMSIEPEKASRRYGNEDKKETVSIIAAGNKIRDSKYSGIITFNTGIVFEGAN